MTVKEVSVAVGMSTETVYRRIRSDQLEAYKNGHGWLVPRPAVLKWLREEQRDSRQTAHDKWQDRIDRVRES